MLSCSDFCSIVSFSHLTVCCWKPVFDLNRFIQMSQVNCGAPSVFSSTTSPAWHCLICLAQLEKSPNERAQSGHWYGLMPKCRKTCALCWSCKWNNNEKWVFRHGHSEDRWFGNSHNLPFSRSVWSKIHSRTQRLPHVFCASKSAASDRSCARTRDCIWCRCAAGYFL